MPADEQYDGALFAGDPRGSQDQQKGPPQAQAAQRTAVQPQLGEGQVAEGGMDFRYTANVGTDARPSGEADRLAAPRRPGDAWACALELLHVRSLLTECISLMPVPSF